MRTLKGRLTVGYAIALGASLLAFATPVYLFQRARFAELDARLQVEADLVATFIGGMEGNVVERVGGELRFIPDVQIVFESIRDYVIVVTQTDVLHSQAPAADFAVTGDTLQVTASSQDENAQVVIAELARLARAASDDEPFGVFDSERSNGEIRYFIRPVIAGGQVARMLTAAPTLRQRLAAERLLVGLLASAPLIFAASIAIGYIFTGRILAPTDELIDEIEAITDGRSLHRRVKEVDSTEELARLTSTLNNMLIRLERNFLSLRRFTADASHELKTPLTVLRSGIERAITHPHAPAPVMEVLEEILVETNRMTELVDSLLMLARADEGRAPLHLDDIDMRELMSEIAETAGILGEQSGVVVEVNVPERQVMVSIDRNRVRQLFMNLLTNAVKYTPRGGRVWITCQQLSDRIEFKIKDTGIGIAAGELPHVFDRFWRADMARSRTGDRAGVGLGLAICKWIAEAHGGSIEVTSKRGQGTTFRVRLPMSTSNSSA